MIGYVRRIGLLLAAGLVASACTSQGSDGLGVAKSAHEVADCDFRTPGYWCGGPIKGARAPAGTCVYIGQLGGGVFDTCAEMCNCFQTANAGTVDDSGLCQTFCDDGMADMLLRAWGAFILSSDAQFGETINFVCPGAPCGAEDVCEPFEVQQILEGCDREVQETVKNCIDDILNDREDTDAFCTFPLPIVDNL